MRYIKMFLFGFGGLFLMMMILGLLIPSNVKISRGVIIDQPYERVYAALNDVQTWEHWMPWVKYDSTAVTTRSGKTSGPGASFSWSGAAAKNEGSLKIVKNSPEEISLLYQLKHEEPAKGGFRIEKYGSSNASVQLIWFMEYRLRWYPWERFYGIFADKMWGPVFETGLNDLKNYLESFDANATVTRGN